MGLPNPTWLLVGNILHFCLLWVSGKSPLNCPLPSSTKPTFKTHLDPSAFFSSLFSTSTCTGKQIWDLGCLKTQPFGKGSLYLLDISPKCLVSFYFCLGCDGIWIARGIFNHITFRLSPSMHLVLLLTNGYESKLSHQGIAEFSHVFYLAGFHIGYLFLTHTQILIPQPKRPMANSLRSVWMSRRARRLVRRIPKGHAKKKPAAQIRSD